MMSLISILQRCAKTSGCIGSNPMASSRDASSGLCAGAGCVTNGSCCVAVVAFGLLARIPEKTDRISSAVSTSCAPCRSKSWHPLARGEWMEPGMAKTSRPYSAAMRAVIRDPDWAAASMTSTPRDRPEISLLRRGKLVAMAGVPKGCSDTMQPAWAIWCASA